MTSTLLLPNRSVDSTQAHTAAAGHTVYRPTEGQLRWAQFHHRRRALAVRESVEALYQTPADRLDVEGALSEDDKSSSSGASSVSGAARGGKPKISRGRRALLRVSQRRLRQRSQVIHQRGFRRAAGAAPSSSSSEEDDQGDALDNIFAEEAVWKRRRRHKKRHSDDRGRRFDQAFHAIMMNFAAAQQPQFATIETPTKIWSRPAETPLVDVNYDAMKQMGISTGSRRQTAAGISSSTMPLIDRGASWLIHLPKTEKISNEARRVTASTASELLPPEGFVVEENVDTPAAPTSSPVRQRFRDIVTDFQTKLAPAGESLDLRLAPSMRLNKYFAPMEETIVDEKKEAESPMGATRLDFAGVQNRIHTFEKKESPSDEDELANILQSMDPDMLEEMEALNPGVKERLRALYLGESSPSVKQLARIIETPTSNEQNQKPEGLVQHFVTQMEQACQRESLMSADGKLHHHTFARLVNQYLLEANGRSPSPRRRQPMVESLVNKLQYSEETDSIIDDEGHLDRPVLEHLVTRYLAEVTGQNEDQIRDAEDWASLQGEDYHVRADFVHGTTAQMRRFVRTVVPRDEGAWREVVERSLISSLPEKGSTIPPPWAVQRLAERCAALIPAAWDEENVGVLQEIVGDTLAEAKQIQRYGFLSPQKPTSPAGFSTPRVKNSLPSPQIQRFVLQIEQAAEVEPLVQNGAFHLPTFSKLVNRYWTEEVEDTMDFNGVHSPLLLARAKRSSTTSRGVPQEEKLKSPGLVKRFLSRMEEAVPDKNLVNSRGRLDHNALEKVVTEQLLMAARFEDSDQAFDLGGESVDDGFASAGFDSPFSPADLDFFSMIRQNRPTAKAKSVLSELTVESPRRTVSMVESTDTEDQPLASAEPRDLAADIAAEKNIARNISGAVSNKVGSLFSRLFHKEVSEHQQKDDMQAVAAFRKSQGERRLSDETSSLSSFRALPEGIKNAVMNFRRISGASEQVEFPQGEVTVTRTSFDSESIASVPHSLSSGMPSEFSPERVKLFHRKVREQSALIGDGETRKSIIDTDGSEASHETMNPDIVASLMLSPTILTKRHQQAFKAIEKRNWDQVTYLISANPWLCEMTDVATNQYLLHKLALFGGGESTANQSTEEAPDMRHPPAPDDLNTDIVRLFPSSVHKFDQDGNLPLHMAAASANTSMATILGDRFPSGATVRNEDGLLPIHLAILACGSPRAAAYGDAANAADMIRTMMNYFPGSVAIPDNEGNLPIHTAVSVLRGDVGVDVIHLLLDEAARQLSDPYGARFRNKITLEDFESTSADTLPTETPTDSDFDDTTKCTMVLNDAGETPLMTAIHARGGWEVIEALIQEPGGRKSALVLDGMKNDALHLLVGEEYQDLAAALSILKIAPETARRRNDDGILPIEIACMQMLPVEVILAIALVDLPIDLDSKISVESQDSKGASWWYLACESDDHFVKVVDEIVSMCNYAQVRELCFMESHNGSSVIARATPKCQVILQKGLRFLGRFEFVGQSALLADPSRGIKIFDAIDFGPSQDPYEVSRRVILKCYSDETVFSVETRITRDASLDPELFEGMDTFSVGENGAITGDRPMQFTIAIERPQLTLSGVVSGMVGNEDCQTNEEVRGRYAAKVFSVLRIVCKGLASLHATGLVHGNISLNHIGKYDGKWKIAEMLGVQKAGDVFDPDRFSPSSPPESLAPSQVASTTHQVAFSTDLVVGPAIDTWALGKLAFEALVGDPLVNFDETAEFDDDHAALMDIMHWNDFNLDEVAEKLRRSSVPDLGIDLIRSCLARAPEERPSSEAILSHPVWKELRRQGKMAR